MCLRATPKNIRMYASTAKYISIKCDLNTINVLSANSDFIAFILYKIYITYNMYVCGT